MEKKFTSFIQSFWEALKPTAYVFFGIVLPAAALIIEMASDMCVDTIKFDPIPTIPHILLVAFVPIALLGWAVGHLKGWTTNSPIWRVALGTVIGISLCYAIPFAPIVPVALIVAFFGIGLLPLSPLGSLVIAGVALYRANKSVEHKGWWGSAGFAIGVAIVCALAWTQIRVENAIDDAGSEEAETQVAAYETLRGYDADFLEPYLCDYKRPQWPNPMTLVTLDDRPYRADYEPELYWRITGASCEKVFWGRGTRFMTDRDKQPGLVMESARLDTSIAKESGIAYTEWLYEVRNTNSWIREADFTMQLPPGAVVSRVTLWVHGEPREATFAGRGQAERAYQEIVSRSRDPILVTEDQPGVIRVRMFPVPAGKVMKARIGVTHPSDSGFTYFPYVSAGNVALDATTDVWMESERPFKFGETPLKETEGIYQLRTEIDQETLSKKVPIEAGGANPVWFPLEEGFVQQTIESSSQDDSDLIIAIDGGLSMESSKADIADALKSLPSDLNVTLLFGGDQEPVVRYESLPTTPENIERLVRAVETYDYVGGRDNVSLLRKAIALGQDEARIVWIHHLQKLSFGKVLVNQREKRRIEHIQVVGGRDIVAENLHSGGRLEAIPRLGEFGPDLKRFIAGLEQTGSRVARRKVDQTVGTETSKHLYRLWAYKRVYQLQADGKRQEALELAANAQIVTNVSAAIVLETKKQYDEFGLDQATGNGVPTIPEPEEWALIIIATLAILGVLYRRRREEDGMVPA